MTVHRFKCSGVEVLIRIYEAKPGEPPCYWGYWCFIHDGRDYGAQLKCCHCVDDWDDANTLLQEDSKYAIEHPDDYGPLIVKSDDADEVPS